MACFSGISNYGICCNHRIQHSLFFCFDDSMKSKIHFSFVQEMVFIEAFRIGMGNSVCGRKSNHYIPASMPDMRTGTAKPDSNTFQQPVELTAGTIERMEPLSTTAGLISLSTSCPRGKPQISKSDVFPKFDCTRTPIV